MPILAENMSNKYQNMYAAARIRSGFKSRADATEVLPIGERTLARIETGEKVPSPDEVYTMAKTYRRQDMLYEYCSKICPIGKEITIRPEKKDLSGSTIGLLKWINDIQKDLGRLVEIAEDNKITTDEVPDLDIAINKILGLWQSIATYKFYVDSELEELRNRKSASAMVAGERVAYGQKNMASVAR